MSERDELELDRALSSKKRPTDPELAALFDAGSGLNDALPAEAPTARQQRALFVQGVGARRSRLGPFRLLAPALAGAALIAALFAVGRAATPGDDLYPIHSALAAVGLAQSPEDAARDSIRDANQELSEASSLIATKPAQARGLTLEAIADLDRARRFLQDVNSGKQTSLANIATLENRAVEILVRLNQPEPQPTETPGDDNGGSNSGPGGGGDNAGGNDKNSGPGGGNSGPGGGNEGSGKSGSGKSGSGSSESGRGDGSGSGSGKSGSGGKSGHG